MNPGTLYIIGTPIGNLEDITFRAIRILKEVGLVLCEDTRMTKKIFNTYDIHTKTMSYHANSSKNKHSDIIALLEQGTDIALVSDAGTPAISDPGAMIVLHVYEHFKESALVVTIPGPSAVTSAISICGVPTSEFTFLGFLPHKKGRQTLFAEIYVSKRAMVFYESPHRIEKTLEELSRNLPSARLVAVARELTKIYEQVVRGSALEVYEYFMNHKDKIRGEFVVIVGGE